MPNLPILPGVYRGSLVEVQNASLTSQSPAAGVRTYIAGSAIPVPLGGLKPGARLRWAFNMAKTAAGVAASTFDIAVGPAGTVADTARVSFSKPAGTAAADDALVVVEAVVRSVSATGVISGVFCLVHNGNTVGHAIIPTVIASALSAGFDNSAEGQVIGLCVTSGAADAITIAQVSSGLTQPS
jgi:hypothetical protein